MKQLHQISPIVPPNLLLSARAIATINGNYHFRMHDGSLQFRQERSAIWDTLSNADHYWEQSTHRRLSVEETFARFDS